VRYLVGAEGVRLGAVRDKAVGAPERVPVGPVHAVDVDTAMTACGMELTALVIFEGDWRTTKFVPMCRTCREQTAQER